MMTEYKGTILGFNYEIELENDVEFKVWLKAKLERYVLKPNDPVNDVLLDVLGIKELQTKIVELDKIVREEPQSI